MQSTFDQRILFFADITQWKIRSLTIASQFEDYKRPLIQHLLTKKVGHWDKSVRELCSKTLAKLAPLDPDFMFNEAIPSLLLTSFNPAVIIR